MGKLADAEENYPRGAVLISGEKIRDVFCGSDPRSGVETKHVVDGGDAFLLPGFVDAHVHCYSEESEGTTLPRVPQPLALRRLSRVQPQRVCVR